MKNLLNKDFSEFLQLLENHKVKYLVVGGYATIIYGYVRYTGDMDIWLLPEPQNADKIVAVLNEFGFESLGLNSQDFSKEYQIIQLGYPPFRIDLITTLDGVSFNDCYERRSNVKIGNLDIPFIGLDELLINKRSSGRKKDLDDVEHLEN